MRVLFFPVTLLLILFSHPALTQCSDAGACSIGGHTTQESLHELSLQYAFGTSGGPDDLVFHSMDITGAIALFSDSRFSLQIPFVALSGPLGSTRGIGDLILLWNQEVLANDALTLFLSGGFRFATGSVTQGGLPQRYQTGLGTNDLLLGLTVETENWTTSLAYQRSRERSENPADRLQRGDDFMVRTGYLRQFDQWYIKGELLLIQRLHESSVLRSLPGEPERFGTVPESNQTQVNVLAAAGSPISDSMELRGFVAVPLFQRNVNLDGLKRAMTLSVAAAFRFP